MSRVVIVGGGVIGLSTAYHLSALGVGSVQVLERHRLTSGTSWHASGTVATLQPSQVLTSLTGAAQRTFPRLERETGFSTGYRVTGGYWLASSAEGLSHLDRAVRHGQASSVPMRPLEPEALLGELPVTLAPSVTGGVFLPDDGTVNPVDLCMAYAKAARSAGAEIFEDCPVRQITTRGTHVTGVELADGSHIPGEIVVLAAGVWSAELARGLGHALPLQPMAHSYLLTEPHADFVQVPLIRVPDQGLYFKGEGGRLLIGGVLPNAAPWDPSGPEGSRPFLELPDDWDRLEPLIERAVGVMPALADVGMRRVMSGPEAFTPDSLPIMGESSEITGLFVSAGFNGRGIMASAGAGQAMASWIAGGARPPGLWPCDLARFDPASAPLGPEVGRAAMSAHFTTAGRPPQGSGQALPLAGLWADAGAEFGPYQGWDVPLGFGTDTRREAGAMARGTALLDLTPLTQLQIKGPDAARLLNDLTCGDFSGPPSRVLHTYFLNRRGGIEAEIVVTTLAEDRFRVTASPAARWSLQRWLRHVSVGYNAEVADATGETCILGVMGAGATSVLTDLVDGGWGDFPMGTYRDMLFARGSFRATRLSVLGESGWEITADPALIQTIAQALRRAGAAPLGQRTIDGCRIEKGHGLWGVDVTADDTPLHCPFGPAVHWGKPFLGHGALEKRKQAGGTRQLILMDLDGSAAASPGDPVMEGEAIVGALTSTALGPRTGRALALGWVKVEPGASLQDTAARSIGVGTAQGIVAATLLTEPAFDPAGARMAA